MGSVTKALEKAVNSMELEKITEVQKFLHVQAYLLNLFQGDG